MAIATVAMLGMLGTGAVATEIGKPIYHSGSNSYYELRNDAKPGWWRQARSLAASRTYKGVRGRLAVVDTREVHEFLKSNFKINQATWIGLRYWCPTSRLEWITGEEWNRGDFGAWARKWHRSAGHCGLGGGGADAGSKRRGYMPVYYLATKNGFLWQASGAAKGFSTYFVQYQIPEKK